MRITVKNYRGIESAVIELTPMALIAGKNYAGKSSICLPVAAAISGQVIPHIRIGKDGKPTAMFNRSQAGVLVRGGMDKGSVSIESNSGKVSLSWPDLESKSEGVPPHSSVYAAGLVSIVDFEDRARSAFLTEMLGSNPGKADLADALPEMTPEHLQRIWDAIVANGWDHAHKDVKEHGARLKGQWEGVTNERYGAAKAVGWLPQSWDESLQGASQQQLESDVADAKKALETAVAGAAVDEHEIARLRGVIDAALPEDKLAAVADIAGLQGDLAQARQGLEEAVANQAVDESEIQRLQGIASSIEKLPDWTADLEAAQAAHQQAVDELNAMPPADKPASTQACPHCEKPLIVVGNTIQAPPKQLSKKEYEKRSRDIESANAMVQAAKLHVQDIEAKIADQRQQIQNAEQAKKKLAEITAKPQITKEAIEAARTRVASLEASIAQQERIRKVRKAQADLEELTSKPTTPATVIEAARERVRIAEERLSMFKAKSQADRIHASIERNQKVIDVLAPDGLRKNKLLRVLEAFNNSLRELCDPAGFKAVSVDEDMDVRYGGRHYALLSASEQYRVRAILQLAIAQRDGSQLVIFDGADILDGRGRNGLLSLLHSLTFHAIVAMTINDRKDVPNLNTAEMGRSYFVVDGVCADIGAAQSAAA